MWLSISRFRFFARSLHLALARTRFFFRSHPRSLVIERMVCSVLAVSLLFLSLVLGGSSEHSLVKVKRARHGKHQKGLANSKSLVESRGTGSFTFYTPGLGACGGTNSENDFIVALSSQSWDGGSHCGEKVTISVNGKTATATIVDECMGCEPGHLDMSPSLFQHFGSLSAGVLHGSWTVGTDNVEKEAEKQDQKKADPVEKKQKEQQEAVQRQDTKNENVTKEPHQASSVSANPLQLQTTLSSPLGPKSASTPSPATGTEGNSDIANKGYFVEQARLIALQMGRMVVVVWRV